MEIDNVPDYMELNWVMSGVLESRAPDITPVKIVRFPSPDQPRHGYAEAEKATTLFALNIPCWRVTSSLNNSIHHERAQKRR